MGFRKISRFQAELGPFRECHWKKNTKKVRGEGPSLGSLETKTQGVQGVRFWPCQGTNEEGMGCVGRPGKAQETKDPDLGEPLANPKRAFSESISQILGSCISNF